ncbi:uncharacterized protein BJ212DRAFT_1477889 [Suillus subaureus]|uniref:Uncharacterized protein n=1 Tax=Suillus subaureus TaxID=48587 RepID=A0A9P7EHV7_9AGAM|nr:uncharacterized protein BJ212DRAFT_1477889 [Suillus subaureus]KAG1822060.1 hypothetical protein BJ212DRAFT_1477889 [Suillus subaureus]
MSSVPMSSGSSTGKCSHSEMTQGYSAPPSTTHTSVLQVMKPESEKKPRLSTVSGKTCLSTSQKTIQDTTNTAMLMNLQGTINHLSDSLNTNFGTDNAHVAEHRSCMPKLMQLAAGILKDDKVVFMHVFMMNAAACGTFLDVDDPEPCKAFLQSMIIHTKQENTTM